MMLITLVPINLGGKSELSDVADKNINIKKTNQYVL